MLSSIAGGIAALVLVALLVWELPAATALGARNARYQSLRGESTSLSGRSATLATSESSAKQQLAAVTALERRTRKHVRADGKTIDGLRTQVASLKHEIAALGG